MSAEPFTLARYSEHLAQALESGYRFLGFEDLDGEPPFVVLRHDIDYSPRRALPVAEIERQLGVSATYCFHVTCPWYSVEVEPHRAFVEAVLEAGHWLGLHFDASEISSDADVVTGVERDARRLEALFGHAVTAVSFHMPGRRTVGGIELPDGLVNVYGPRFFEEIAYVSDSNQDWRGTDVEALFAGRAVNRLQLLTHPFWWRESYGTIGEKLEELAAELGVAVEEIATWEQVELIRRGAA